MHNNKMFFLITLALCTLPSNSFAMNYAGSKALEKAIIADNPVLITEAVETYSINLNNVIIHHSKYHPESPLEFAISKNRPKAVACLIENGADAKAALIPKQETSSEEGGTTPLIHFALGCKACPDIVELLLKNGAGACCDSFGFNALHNVCLRTAINPKIIELLAQEISLHDRTPEGKTPLHMAMIAASADNYPTVKKLLELGANPNETDFSEKTPLDYIMQNMKTIQDPTNYIINRYRKIAKLLLICGANSENYTLEDYFTQPELAFVKQEKAYLQTLNKDRKDVLCHHLSESTQLPSVIPPIISDYYGDIVPYDLRRLAPLEEAEQKDPEFDVAAQEESSWSCSLQ